MYLGSIKFYKHLIYIATILILVLALVGLFFLISLIIPNSSAEAANIDNLDNINNTSYSQEKSNDSNIEVSNNQAPSEPSNNLNSKDSEEPMAFEIYPDLYCDKPSESTVENKTAYLTFDDGPSAGTAEILDILKEKNIKATFFVVTGGANSSNISMLKQIVDEGHAVGIHSHSHIYKEIYDSVDSFLKDMNTSFNIIYETTKIKPTVIRFAGGSVNDINTAIYDKITNEVLKRNFNYYDWNVSFEDAKSNITAEEIYKSALDGIEKNNGNNLIILAHDRANNYNTLQALKQVIDVLETYGYSFDKLDNSVEPITFSYK